MSRDFRLLGAFEFTRGAVTVSLSNKLRVVLATLLLAHSRPVPFETLIEALWGDRPPESARANLQVYVMRVRRALGDDDLVKTTGGCYRLDVPAAQIDVARFHDLTARARQAGRPETEAALLGEGLALWRGPALLGVESDSLHQTVVPLLTEERLRAAERRAELTVELGRPEEVIAELTTLVREHPLRERPWACLIDALSRSGRRADALAAYRQVQTLFRDELGIEPDGRVQAVHQRVLTEDGPAPVRPGQLPAEVPIVGRTRERAELRQRLAEAGRVTPVVVVSGPPGVGKTALAVHVAHRVRETYPDGQLYADLRGYAHDEPLSPALVLERFLRALGVSAIPDDLAEQAGLYRSLLAEQRVLVLLDNAATSGQVRPLLPGGAGCAALVTSRQDLRGLAVTDGGLGLALGPMHDREAADLLTGMVGAARVRAEPDALDELVAACGRLPLALRIAGANLAADPHLPLSVYNGQLRDRGKVAGLSVPGDSIAVRAAFDLSYLRLPAVSARLFRALGVAPGPDFAVPAAAALMAADPAEAARTLDGLAAANLIFPTAFGRYQMHDLIRVYAAGRAAEDTAESRGAIGRLLDFQVHSARNATGVLYPGQPRSALPAPGAGVRPLEPATEREALSWLNAELPNLVAAAVRAQDHGRPHHARQLAETLRGHLWELGYRVEGFAVWDAALAAARDDGDPRVEAAALDLTGLIHYVLGRYGQAIEHHRRALAVAGGSLSLHNLARANAKLGRQDEAAGLHQKALGRLPHDDATRLLHLNHAGFSHFVSGRPALAAAQHREALDVGRRLGDLPAQAQAWNGLGLAAWALGDLTESIEAHERACAIAAEIGDEHLRGFSLIWLAAAQVEVGRYAEAADDAQAGIEIGLAVGEPRHEVVGTVVRTLARFRAGSPADAVDVYRTALRRARDISFDHGAIPLLAHLAEAERHAGLPREALDHASQSLRTCQANGIRIMEPMARTEIALCHLALGALAEAEAQVAEALRLAVESAQRPAEAAAHHASGLVSTARGDFDSATAAWGTALGKYTEIGSPAAAECARLLRYRRG